MHILEDGSTVFIMLSTSVAGEGGGAGATLLAAYSPHSRGGLAERNVTK